MITIIKNKDLAGINKRLFYIEEKVDTIYMDLPDRDYDKKYLKIRKAENIIFSTMLVLYVIFLIFYILKYR